MKKLILLLIILVSMFGVSCKTDPVVKPKTESATVLIGDANKAARDIASKLGLSASNINSLTDLVNGGLTPEQKTQLSTPITGLHGEADNLKEFATGLKLKVAEPLDVAGDRSKKIEAERNAALVERDAQKKRADDMQKSQWRNVSFICGLLSFGSLVLGFLTKRLDYGIAGFLIFLAGTIFFGVLAQYFNIMLLVGGIILAIAVPVLAVVAWKKGWFADPHVTGALKLLEEEGGGAVDKVITLLRGSHIGATAWNKLETVWAKEEQKPPAPEAPK